MVARRHKPSKPRSSNPWRTFQNVSLGVLAWLIALAFFFPILWMIMSAFKTEDQAFTTPPIIVFQPIFENFTRAFAKYGHALLNSLLVAFGSTILSFLLGLPAAFSMVFYPTKRSRSTLLWFVSTKMMPPVGVIVPLYLIFKDLHLLDTVWGLTLMYTTMNMPLVIWMMHSYISEIPSEILEAAKVDGASLRQEFINIAMPLAVPGIASTALLCLIFAWNEAFFALNLTNVDAAPLSVYISAFKTSEGLFWAQLSAAATLVILPVMAFGWSAQRQLIQGLTMGAVK
jgi:sorbitol/mannitol transport system permease protein